MCPSSVSRESAATTPQWSTVAGGSLTVQRLNDEHETEVLGFLSMRPLHAVIMSGFIRDNGMVSPLNRGTFYACRDMEGRLQGIALIGHTTLFEAHNKAALEAFARLAQSCSSAHVIMGEREKIEHFWTCYGDAGQAPRLMCRELLFEQRWPVEVSEIVRGLRTATLADLEMVMPVQAEMAFQESGVNPMQVDSLGFRLRCARRIEQGRVWVWMDAGRLIFKADVIIETRDATYIEGVWVNPQERRKGYALRCVSQLSRILLQRTSSVSILVNEQNLCAQSLYRRAGYKLRGCYDTIFMQRKNH